MLAPFLDEVADIPEYLSADMARQFRESELIGWTQSCAQLIKGK